MVDPYQWLEDLTSEDTKKFYEDQNEIIKSVIEASPEHAKIKENLKKAWKYDTHSVPSKHGKYYISTENVGLKKFPYVTIDHDRGLL